LRSGWLALHAVLCCVFLFALLHLRNDAHLRESVLPDNHCGAVPDSPIEYVLGTSLLPKGQAEGWTSYSRYQLYLCRRSDTAQKVLNLHVP
jgi:hypothetical protein